MPSAPLYLDSPIGRGPLLGKIRLRVFLIWGGAALLGLLPFLLDSSPQWQAFGLGLWLPGGGFLYSGAIASFIFCLLFFIVSLVLWLLVGGFIFPVLAWLIPAGLAASLATNEGMPWALTATVVTSLSFITAYFLLGLRKKGDKHARAVVLAEHLATHSFVPTSASAPLGEPLTDKELASLRYMLDLALQPIDEFTGFVKIDQFREAAWRYQLVAINYALAGLQTSRLPAFAGYLHEAQRRAIVKMKDRRVWKYWRVENALGNFRIGADPIVKDNIMYSGWWALALGAYERATGDRQFSQQDALTLEESSKKQFRYDYPKIVDVMAKQFEQRSLCLFPCEPNWVFAICNLFGMTGALVFDKINGTRKGLDHLERFNNVMETEFTMAEGRTATIMSSRSGIILAGGGAFAYLGNIWLLNMTSPRMAQAYWILAKYMLKEEFGEDMKNWHPTGPATLDAGNYSKNGVFFWITIMQSAKEMGDLEIFEYAQLRYEEMGTELKGGALHHKGSVMAQCFSHIARFSTPGCWYRMAHGDVPAAITNGPRLENVPYPAVLVAAADNDGKNLEITLCCEDANTINRLEFSRLIPKETYHLLREDDTNLGQLLANDDGFGEINTALLKRDKLRLVLINK